MCSVSNILISNPAEYFNVSHLTDYFNQHLIRKSGGGRDNLSPRKYWEKYNGELSTICRKCLDGTYRFSYYNEKLVLKGSNKKPRVLSIPTVRDRLVLGVLNEYLSEVFSECVSHEIPNKLINEIDNYISTHSDKKISFLRTDFHDFYGSIRIKLLMDMLRSKITDENIIALIFNAVTTPTVSGSVPKALRRTKKKGIPQGLSISNILAAIYMHSFDEEYGKPRAGLYIRYVDDILFLDANKVSKRQMLMEIRRRNLGLKFSPDKCKSGIIGKNSLDFIGYAINKKIFVRQKNVTRFLNRVASLATKFKEGKDDHSKRPRFIKKDPNYNDYYKEGFIELLSGFKYENHLYGWIAYYQGITDISSLYGMDRVIRENILKELPLEILRDINSLVDTYYDIRRYGGKNLVPDYDKLDTVGEKEFFLKKKGWIDSDRDYSDEQINNYFDSYIRYLKRRTEHDIGKIS